MLYVKHFSESGKEEYVPITDDNVYIDCAYCKKMVWIPDPAGYLYETGEVGASIESEKYCDRCIDIRCEIEDALIEWKKKNPNYTQKDIRRAVAAVKKRLRSKGFTDEDFRGWA